MHWDLLIRALTIDLDNKISIPLDKVRIVQGLLREKVHDRKGHHEIWVICAVPDVGFIKSVSFNVCVHYWVVLQDEVLELLRSEHEQNVEDQECQAATKVRPHVVVALDVKRW